jgi:hypothetical protein
LKIILEDKVKKKKERVKILFLTNLKAVFIFLKKTNIYILCGGWMGPLLLLAPLGLIKTKYYIFIS